MKEFPINFIWILLWSLLNYSNLMSVRGSCPIVRPQCPVGYELRNEWCHYVGNDLACPPNYERRDNLCYLQEDTDCMVPDMSRTLSPITTATITTIANNNSNDTEQDRCPEDSIFMNEKCRKIICSLGEYYKGRCLQSACPPGLVWYNKHCQRPAYILTVLEIDNKIVNDKRNHPFTIIQNTTNFVEHNQISSSTKSPTTTTTTTMTTTKMPNRMGWRRTTTKTTTTTKPTTTTEKSHVNVNDTNCCVLVTPRICKIYGMKWVCFNRRQQLCDGRVCSAHTVYLKAPEIHFKHPVLIMPPNPVLEASNDTEMNGKQHGIDCSGCINSQHTNCSSYCYHYICPEGVCVYMNLQEYCNYYTGQFGCLEQDGCLWNWC